MGKYTEKGNATQKIHIRGDKPSVTKQEVRHSKSDSGRSSWFSGGAGNTPHVTKHSDGSIWKTDGNGKASSGGGSGK